MLKVKAEKLGDVTVLHLRGQIVNGAPTTTLREAVFARAEGSALVLDLTKVGQVDAGGLGALLEVREWAQSREIEFRLVNVARHVQEVLEITHLDSVFEISPVKNRIPLNLHGTGRRPGNDGVSLGVRGA
jgi:anti-anti-sigma factor